MRIRLENELRHDDAVLALPNSETTSSPGGEAEMQDNCILCGKEVQRGGYSATVEGVVLRPLCPNCDSLCSKQPKRVLDEHREVFERALAERRDLIARQTALAEVYSPPEPAERSQRELS